MSWRGRRAQNSAKPASKGAGLLKIGVVKGPKFSFDKKLAVSRELDLETCVHTFKEVFLERGGSQDSAVSGANHDGGAMLAQTLPPEDVLFGKSATMQEIRRKVEKIAAANVAVLLEGESGTGKEVLARWVHERSPWRNGQFIKVNCAAIPGSLLESELFGYEKGAFTGATERKAGRIELAHGGTLFLDEIAEIDFGLQSKLLQALQDGRFCRIGGSDEQHVETRLICATNRNLEKQIEAGKFRADLFHRINVIRIQMPRLRDRKEDVLLLADHFLSHHSERFERAAPPFSRKLMHDLVSSEWPGNIRELENRVARYVLLGEEESFGPTANRRLGARASFEMTTDGSIPLKRIAKQACREMGREVILRALQANHWNRRRTAEELKISYRALLYKIREAGLPSRRSQTHSKETSPFAASGADPVK